MITDEERNKILEQAIFKKIEGGKDWHSQLSSTIRKEYDSIASRWLDLGNPEKKVTEETKALFRELQKTILTTVMKHLKELENDKN